MEVKKGAVGIGGVQTGIYPKFVISQTTFALLLQIIPATLMIRQTVISGDKLHIFSRRPLILNIKPLQLNVIAMIVSDILDCVGGQYCACVTNCGSSVTLA